MTVKHKHVYIPFPISSGVRHHPGTTLKEKDRRQDCKHQLPVNPNQCLFPESMRGLCVSLLVYCVLLGCLGHAGAAELDAATQSEGVRSEEREKRSLPYWNLWSSDFVGWLEELRAQGSYDKIQDLARTFWAHFPIASALGYDAPDSDAQPGE